MASTPQGNTVQVVLTMDGASYSAALDKAQKQLDQFKGKATATGKAVGNALGGEDVREKIHLLAETIGIRLPRSLQSVIAKSEAAKMAVGALGGAIVGLGALEFGGAALIEGISKIREFFTRLQELPHAIDEAFGELHTSAQLSNDELQKTNDELRNAITKLEKKPQNNVAIAMDEARIATDKLAKSAQEALKRVTDVLKANHVGLLDQVFGTAGTGEVETGVKKNRGDIADATYELNDATHRGDQAGIQAANKKIADAKTAYAQWIQQQIAKRTDFTKGINTSGQHGNQDANLAILRGERVDLSDDADTSREQSDNATLSSKYKQLSGDKSAASAAATARMQQFQSELEQMKQNTSVSAKAEYDYWAARISAFTKGSEQYQAVQRQMSSIAVEGAKAAHEALAKGMKDVSTNANLDPKEAAAGIDAFNKLLREQAEDVSMTGVRWREYNAELAKAAELQVTQAGAMRGLQVQHAQQTGTLSKEAAAQQMAGIQQADSEAEIKILQSKLAELQSDLKNLDPNSKDYEAQRPQMQAQVAAAMAAVQSAQGNAAQQAMQDQMNISDNSVWGQLKNSLSEFAEQVTNVGAVLSQFATHSLSTINNAILNPGHAGSHPWSNAAASIGKSAEGSALQFGEGKVLGMLGLGGGKLGTKGNPMIVQLSDATSGLTSGITGALGAAKSTNGFLATLGGFAHMLGFASGGNANAGTLAMVGEHGPELAYFGSDAHITPNSALRGIGGGGGDVYNIDARNSTNPALTAAHVQMAMAHTKQQAVAEAVAKQQEISKRRP